MRTPRVTQNFRDRTAVILTPGGRSLDALETTLRRLGLTPEPRPLTVPQQGLELPENLLPEQHIVLIDGDLSLPPVWPESYGLADAMAPCPTIGLVGIEAPSRLKALFQLGALSLLPKPIHSGSVYSALFLAVNEFSRMNGLQGKLDDLTERRRKRIHVIRAVAALMRQQGLTEDAAYDVLRKDSMRARVSIEDHCEILMRARPEGDAGRQLSHKRCQTR
ncbi:ANTAR domain-containing response regulator [Celeribacter neptunius]|uniref:Two-component response regulator, AmiR/NasT family, consists of REC and RNA-binding antiterminator (ANTAR) domains n=1 Tax=Celeribacter neptunius TaxID=588602 RepID=A0A1I3KJG7_9RHOB|nr:ANTAR domain-containing protein [Celeribacter neptunius]SFI72597.1 Two-component response regulator, AmiR/NasT family, consists of REC and RNA-binding antiterminator (ANTAR) domains [Celeribacter neptunius]